MKLLAFVLLCGFLMFGIEPHAKELGVPYAKLPLPVKAYILTSAAEVGFEGIEQVASNSGYNDQIPVKGSDLNSDGRRDYAVALCMWDLSVRQFQTNGFPCAFGSLMLSNTYGGYQFITINGLVVDAKAGKKPTIIIRQRQFSNECKDYLCDFEYTIEREPILGREVKLELRRACDPNRCTQ